MTLHAKPNLLSQPQDGTVGKVFTYTCDHDLALAFVPEFFDVLRNNLLPGDTIRLIRKDNIAEVRKCKVLARQDAIVVEVTAQHVTVAPDGELRSFEQRAEAPKAGKKAA